VKRRFNYLLVVSELGRTGKTRTQFAEEISTPDDTVSRERLAQYTTGRSNPPPRIAARIAEALGVDADSLWVTSEPASREAVDELGKKLRRLEQRVEFGIMTAPTHGSLALVPRIIDMPRRTQPVLPDFEDGYDFEMLSGLDEIQRAEIPASWLTYDAQIFGVLVSGDHLAPDFHDSELIAVSPRTSPAGGSWVYFRPFDTKNSYVARYWPGAEGVTLTPAGSQNLGFRPLVIRDGEDPPGAVLGTVVGSVRTFRRME